MGLTLLEAQGVRPGNYLYDVHDQLKRHVYSRSEKYFAMGDADRDQLKSKEQIITRQKWIRRAFLKSIGGLPENAKNLDARFVGRIECESFNIEKVIFQSRANCYITSNLYIPKMLKKPSPAILFVCGHHERAKHEPEYQIICQNLVQAGFIVLAYDPIGQGERLSYYEPDIKDTTVRWGTFEHDYAGCQCFAAGSPIARYFLHDSMCAIDYLISRPEVDAKRIGITGNSGGGLQTCMMMMADPRIAAAVPGTFVMNRQSYMYTGTAQDAEQIWPGLTKQGWDHEDMLIAMAPKPVCVLAVKYDFFPIEGTRETVARAQRSWKAFEKEKNLELVEDTCRHNYTPFLARAATKFFARHLLGSKIDTLKFKIDVIEPSKLWCTKSGQIKAELDAVSTVFNENMSVIKTQNKLSKISGSKSAINWLKSSIFNDRQECDLNPRNYWSEGVDDFWVDAWIWWSQKDIFNHAMLYRSYKNRDTTIPVTIALWDGGVGEITKHIDFIRCQCQEGKSVLITELTGMGSLKPNDLSKGWSAKEFYGVFHKLNNDLLWLDDSIAAIRIYDLIRSLDFIGQQFKSKDSGVYTVGRYSLYAKIAKMIDKRINSVESIQAGNGVAPWAVERHYNYDAIHTFLVPDILRHFSACGRFE
jgi:hypothetical protein